MPAPKRNRNALKHGIFSQFIAVIDDVELVGMQDNDPKDELAYARVKLKQATLERDRADGADEKLKWDFACRHWTEIVTGIIHRNADRRETEQAVFTSLIEAVRAANDRQNWQR